ncbi:MAG: glycosyltransferase family 39 protein [Phycisphaerales bacterium]|nr:glycosyltransferase family 39 protein [Phycisphaerales bacterium]
MLNAPPQPPGKSLNAFAVSIIALTLIIGPLLILSQLAAHLRGDVVDDQMFAYYGWRIAHGGTVYLDVWDNKPPGIYWINALGFLITDSYMGIALLCAAALVIAHICFYIIASSVYFPAAAAVTTALASFYITHARYQGGSNRTETFLVPCELLAVALYVRGFARDRNWKWLVAGLCCGAAVLFKQVGVAALGAMGLHLIWLMIVRSIPFRTGVRRGLLILAGFGATISIATAYLASEGALAEAWFAAVTFNQSYFNVGDSGLTNRLVNRWKLGHEMYPILILPTLMAIATLIHASLWALRPHLKPAEIEQPVIDYKPIVPHYLILFGLWTLIGFYGATVSPHAFRHYIIPFIPPLVLFSGYIVNLLQAEASVAESRVGDFGFCGDGVFRERSGLSALGRSQQSME